MCRSFAQNPRLKKEVVIYDFVDLDVPILDRIYDRRIKGYRSIGDEIEDEQS